MSNTHNDAVLHAPNLTWQDDGLPISQKFNDPYFSLKSGLEESRYVFLQHNGLPERWQTWPWQTQASFCITETGFGTGLNFLVTWYAWRNYRKENKDSGWLHFTSVEKFPLTCEQLQKSLDLWPELKELSALLINDYPLPLRGTHHLTWPDERISLTLWFNDVHDALPNMSGPVHAWFLDGFSPAKNPDMWNDALFKNMRALSQCHPSQYSHQFPATFSTFAAASVVRKGLIGAGFHVLRDEGFGKKREMLHGTFKQKCGPELPAVFTHKPWTLTTQQPHQDVVIIGAGLAGASTARALAERGIKSLVLDEHGIANKASGNPQGGMYIKLAAADDAIHTDFYLSAFEYALPFMTRYLGNSSNNPNWRQCGVLQLAYDDKEQTRQQKFIEEYPLPKELIYPVSAEEASSISGSTHTRGGLFFPKAGWVSPNDLCTHLLNHANIEVRQERVINLTYNDHDWLVQTQSQNHQTTHVVLATAFDTTALLSDAYLPIKNIRGQLSFVRAEISAPLNTVLCGRSYMAPAKDGKLCLGATYNLRDTNTELRDSDHQINLNNLADFGPEWESVNSTQGLNALAGGRVGFRCTTPDYLPMAGPVPLTQNFTRAFAKLAKNSNQIPPVECEQYKGLWLNIGHGSRGLVSAPLCGELIAAMICNDALPMSVDMAEALWPGRFLLRDVIRRKISAE